MMWLRFDLIPLLVHATLKVLAWLFPKVDENCALRLNFTHNIELERKGKQRFLFVLFLFEVTLSL